MSKRNLIVIAAILSLVLLLVCLVAAAGVGWWISRQVELVIAGPTATSTPVPVIDRTPVARPETGLSPGSSATSQPGPDSGGEVPRSGLPQLSTEQILLNATLPERDQRLLAMRLKLKGQEIPLIVHETPPQLGPGDTYTFWVTDNEQEPPRQFQATAALRYITDHSYWWVEEGFSVSEADLQRSAERFEQQTYPTNRAFFGSEWSPGVDSDVRVHVFMGDVPGVAGYYSASNQYSRLAEPYSNEREMFFINLKAMSPGNDYFDSVLAHEFQHMIHWHQDRNEDTWVNEGFSELATFINGYGPSSFMGPYAAVPDTQLTSWADSPNAAVAHYGGSFLLMAYFLQRYGEDMTRAAVSRTENGLVGFNAVLAENGFNEQIQDVFADFLVANYLNDPDAGSGLWGYRDLTPGPVALSERYSVYPVEKQATVYQYGADYIELTGQGNVTIEFNGSTSVRVVDNQAHSGEYQWYSHRGDDSNTRLTHAFDLTGVESATLQYWTWYDIETDWDYGYVEISTDGGESWTILQTPHSATDNPSGNAYGPGYTGSSGSGPAWVEEKLDISAYAGREVLVRFEYVTDDAVNRPGLTIDDVSIPEINFYDDMENGPGEWVAEGFVRIDNVLAQPFLVQVVEIGDAGVTVEQMPLDRTNSGTLTVENLGSEVEQAVLIVSGLAPITTQPASYQYQLSAR